MAKAKNADELAEISSSQLDILTAEGVSNESVRVADAVANQIGKLLKLAGLRIAYHAYKKEGGPAIQTLEARSEEKA